MFKTLKLGKSRAGARSRVWIEGKQLEAAGFRAGRAYYATWTSESLTLTTSKPAARDGALIEERTISGKAGRPVIDITGERVMAQFGKRGPQIQVSMEARLIVITPA